MALLGGAVGNHDGGAGVFQHEGYLVGTVVGVDWHRDGTQGLDGEIRPYPFGAVPGKNGDAVVALDAGGDEARGDFGDDATGLGPGDADVLGRIGDDDAGRVVARRDDVNARLFLVGIFDEHGNAVGLVGDVGPEAVDKNRQTVVQSFGHVILQR